MDKTELDELQSRIAVEMDDQTCDGLESLYFHVIEALTDKSYDDLWSRYNELYELGVSCETDTVNRVGEELGFPPMWGLIGAMITHMEEKRCRNTCTRRQQPQTCCKP